MVAYVPTLAGRVAMLTLDPLSVPERERRPSLSTADEVIEHLWAGPASEHRVPPPAVDVGAWLLRGGYPGLALDPDADRQLWLGGYVQAYLERDVRDLVQVGDLGAFARFLGLVAARTGGVLNMADLARDAGVTGPTVRRWLSVLGASRAVHVLRPYDRNLGKRLVKSPRLYLLDTGLASLLLGRHSAEAALQGPAAGALVETAVAAEWVKAFRQAGELPSLYCWRSSAGLEVDPLVERNGRLYALDAKATRTPVPLQVDSLVRWLELAGGGSRAVLARGAATPSRTASWKGRTLGGVAPPRRGRSIARRVAPRRSCRATSGSAARANVASTSASTGKPRSRRRPPAIRSRHAWEDRASDPLVPRAERPRGQCPPGREGRQPACRGAVRQSATPRRQGAVPR